jgi:hypothetical protein
VCYFIDRGGDDPLDGCDIGFRHVHLLIALLPTSAAAFRLPSARMAAFGNRPHLRVMMLDLSDQETDALAGLLRRTIDDDRYPLSPRWPLRPDR